MTVLADLSRALADLAGSAAAAVVGVAGPRTRASGLVWREGLVVAADEALDDEEGLELLLPDGARVGATLVGRDPSTDVALLRAAGPLPAPVALDAGPRRLGEAVLAVGRSPEGAVAAWGVLGLAGPAWRSMRGGAIDARLGLDLRLPRAAEGGLAVDAEGRAFGMAVFGPRRSALAIPAATVERVAEQLLAHGRVARGYLGVSLQPVRVEGREAPGAVVVGLEPDGPARRAGLLQGDILLAVAGEPPAGLRHRLGPETVGTEVEVEVLRGGEARTLRVLVAERPER